MKVLVTGASGFLGRAVVANAVAAGHQVIAMVRPTTDADGLDWPADQVTVVRGDLRQIGTWSGEIHVAEAVIHLAASLSGDLATQFSGTVVATENLLAQVDVASLARFVHVSSFSVYDFTALRSGGVLTEATPIEPLPEERDAYTATKIIQERMVIEACSSAGTPFVVLRPGAIYGPGKDWDFGAAVASGRCSFIFSPRAPFRLTYVENCADAIVRALEAPMAVGRVLNIVDDDLPSHAAFFRMCRKAGAETGRAIPVPWLLLAAAGKAVAVADKVFFKGAKLPEVLAYRRQQARWKPLRYSNEEAKRALDWAPKVAWRDAVRAMIGRR